MMVGPTLAVLPLTSPVMTLLGYLLVNSYTKQHMLIKKMQYDPHNHNPVITCLSLLSPLKF